MEATTKSSLSSASFLKSGVFFSLLINDPLFAVHVTSGNHPDQCAVLPQCESDVHQFFQNVINTRLPARALASEVFKYFGREANGHALFGYRRFGSAHFPQLGKFLV